MQTDDEKQLQTFRQRKPDGTYEVLNKRFLIRNGLLLDPSGRFNPAMVRKTASIAGIPIPYGGSTEAADKAFVMQFVKEHIHLFNACIGPPSKAKVSQRRRIVPA